GFVGPALSTEFGIAIPDLGPVFSAALVGLLIGATMIGALGDRYGRKTVIAASTFIFGFFSLLTAFAQSVDQLMVLRFLTGLGLGGAMPNIVALTTEYSPKRRKYLMVVVMFAGFPLGGVLGGLISTELITIYGWRAVFAFGGVLPILLSVFLRWRLPESIPFLITKEKSSSAKVAAYLNRIAPTERFSANDEFVLPDTELNSSRPGLRNLFAGGRMHGTLALWLISYINLLTIYFISVWLPTLLIQVGHSLRIAIASSVIFNAGSMVGAVSTGYFADKSTRPLRIIAANYLGAAAFTALIGLFAQSLVLGAIVVFGAGYCVTAGQAMSNPLSSNFYPAAIRSTGVAAVVGWGRFGAICGPLYAGMLLAAGLGVKELFYVIAAPALLAATAMIYMEHVTRPHDSGPASLG
ncbi:MAG: MFS transporter, partial [Alphaproteobacteria bacterium]|nr:MFS transporter [Alphaproteobacteria bacterium]